MKSTRRRWITALTGLVALPLLPRAATSSPAANSALRSAATAAPAASSLRQAYCLERLAPRTFRLDRMISANPVV